MREERSEVTAFIAEWVQSRHGAGDSFQAIADVLDVSKTTVQHVADGSRGVGPSLETAFAKKFFAGSLDALRDAATKASAERAKQRSAGEDLPAALLAAIEMERVQRPVPDDVVEIARDMARVGVLKRNTWISILDDLITEHEAASAAAPNGRGKRSAS